MVVIRASVLSLSEAILSPLKVTFTRSTASASDTLIVSDSFPATTVPLIATWALPISGLSVTVTVLGSSVIVAFSASPVAFRSISSTTISPTGISSPGSPNEKSRSSSLARFSPELVR